MLSGRRLRELRKSKGYTQEFLATKLGVSKVTVCGYEKETRTPSLNIFLQLLDIFEVETNYLLGRDNLVSEENTDYKIKMSKEDIKIIKDIKNNKVVYNKFLDNSAGVINFIERKLKK